MNVFGSVGLRVSSPHNQFPFPRRAHRSLIVILKRDYSSSIVLPLYTMTTAILFPSYHHATPGQFPPEEIIRDDDDDNKVERFDGLAAPEFLASPFPVPTPIPDSSDDIGTEQGLRPFCQVDYLTHDWTEYDLWSSRKYVRKHRAEYPQSSARLENALWRVWAKSKYKLKTVTPEALNWYAKIRVFLMEG